jgi:hypothetical protein
MVSAKPERIRAAVHAAADLAAAGGGTSKFQIRGGPP